MRRALCECLPPLSGMRLHRSIIHAARGRHELGLRSLREGSFVSTGLAAAALAEMESHVHNADICLALPVELKGIRGATEKSCHKLFSYLLTEGL